MLCKIPNVSFALSLGTFGKHLSPFRSKTLCSRSIDAKTLATSNIHSLSSFETLTSRQKDQIHLYVDTLLQWNQRMNLTAVTEADEVMERHVHDSLAIIPPLRTSYVSHCSESCDEIRLIDVGSGAGLPGLILAIACPGWKVTLMDSMNKRCVFLENAISVIGLLNVQVVRGRAEELGRHHDFREIYDVAVARAVAEMKVLAEYCLPFVRVGGLFVAAKGHDPQEEVKNAERAIKIMGASVFKQCSVESSSPHGQRTAIICFKDRSTPGKYPREPGTPGKLPL